MDQYISSKQAIESVIIPASKSYAQRAIIAAALSTGTTIIQNTGSSKDVQAILLVAEKLGAKIEFKKEDLQITGTLQPSNHQLNVGESGLGMRLVTAIAAVLDGDFEITAEGSLRTRPMDEFAQILPQIGINYVNDTKKGVFQISGKAHSASIKMQGDQSSQYLSGMLMALPLLKGDSEITVSNLKSTPYIQITLDVLRSFNIKITHKDFATFQIPGGQHYNTNLPYTVEGDYSGASIWMVHGALQKGILIKGLHPDSTQGDKKMLAALEAAAVGYQWTADGLQIQQSTPQAFEFDATDCPDLFPSLVVLAAGAIGTSTIKGVNRLTHKESNRGKVLQTEFKKLGLEITIADDAMNITGRGWLSNGSIHSHNDHRIAMAGAVAASLTADGILIQESESVSKSYPNFWAEY